MNRPNEVSPAFWLSKNLKKYLFAGSEEDELKHLTDSLKELGKTRSCSHKHLQQQNKVTVFHLFQHTLLKIVFKWQSCLV